MTAPTRTRGKPATAPPDRKSGRRDSGDRSGTRGAAGTRSAAAERAYARRAQRVDQARRAASGAGEASRSGMSGRFRLRMPRSRASFVLLIMAMLATGVVATLWLTTQAIAGSYKLERLHEHNAELAERVAKLERVVTKRESATWLAEQARQLGMVPGGTPAKLVVQPDGSITVVGEPKKVTAPAPPPPPEPAAEPEAGTADGGTAGSEQQPQDDDAGQAPPEQESSGQDSAAQEQAEQDTQAAGAGD